MDREIFKETLKYGKCISGFCKGKNPGTADHTCPYNIDIHNDRTFNCNCCETCTAECAYDI